LSVLEQHEGVPDTLPSNSIAVGELTDDEKTLFRQMGFCIMAAI